MFGLAWVFDVMSTVFFSSGVQTSAGSIHLREDNKQQQTPAIENWCLLPTEFN